MRIARWRRWLPEVIVVVALAGCAGTGASTVGTPVAVTDIASLAGKWSGLVDMQGSRDRQDLVELTVDSSGTYRAFTARTIGVLNAQGNVAVASDGRVLFQGTAGGRATGRLYTSDTTPPQRSLLLEGVTPQGRPFSARLRQEP